MSYGRMLSREQALEEEVARWQEEAERQASSEEDELYGRDDGGYSLPPELREPGKRLQRIREAKARLEQRARTKAEAEGKDPAEAVVAERAQSNFTGPESRIMHTPDGFQQCYNGQAAVDAQGEVIVACEVSQAPPDVQRLIPMLERIIELTVQAPGQLSADAGYASEVNFAALDGAGVHAVIALRRYHRDEPPVPTRRQNAHPSDGRTATPCAPASPHSTARPSTGCANRPSSPSSARSKEARGFRRFLRRGLAAVESEWTMACTVHNLLKLQKALGTAGQARPSPIAARALHDTSATPTSHVQGDRHPAGPTRLLALVARHARLSITWTGS
jgi:hypothetical protein